MSDAIVIERLTKHYGPRRVVDTVNLRVPTGCVYGFLGRNGAGKSTLIKMLMGLVQPDAGRATLLNEDSRDLPPATRCGGLRIWPRGIRCTAACASPRPCALCGSFYVNTPFPAVWHDRFVSQVLDHFRISPDGQDSPPLEWATGPSFAGPGPGPDPDLLVLDDPTLGLDTVVRRDFLESIIHLIQRGPNRVFQLAHALGRRARGRPDRHHGRRRVTRRLPNRSFQVGSAARGARVRRHLCRVFHPARAWSASGKSAAGSS